MSNPCKFLFSGKDLEKSSEAEILFVINHIKNEVPKIDIRKGGEKKENSNCLYLELLNQCNDVGALIGMRKEEDKGRNNKDDDLLYLFKKEENQLYFLSFENNEFILSSEFPIALLSEKMIYLVESKDRECFKKALKSSHFKIAQTIESFFNWFPKKKNTIFSLIGTTLWQTWTFLIEDENVFFLFPKVDNESGKIFWEKTSLVPLNFLFEKDFIFFYEEKKDLGKELTHIISLQKKIFNTFNEHSFPSEGDVFNKKNVIQ